MAIWKDPTQPKKDTAYPDTTPTQAPVFASNEPVVPASMMAEPPARPAPPSSSTAVMKESVIASDLSIEGKIQGAGHVRIAGRFKGDVDVKGDLTIEQGAKLDGSVRADKVVMSGELDGNIIAANRVELLASCAMNGDIKANTLTVVAGSRLRGHVECGSWESAGKRDNAGDAASREADSTSV